MLLRKHLFLPISFPAFLFSCRLVRMSHSAVSQSRRLHFILLPAPSQPCGHRQVLRYPVPITHLVLLILPSFASSQLLFFFPHRTLHHTTRTFTSATLRCPILFATISWPFLLTSTPLGTDSPSLLPISAVNPSDFVPITFSSHPVFPFSFHYFYLLAPFLPYCLQLADSVLGTRSLQMDKTPLSC
jgi:hypothetical protein